MRSGVNAGTAAGIEPSHASCAIRTLGIPALLAACVPALTAHAVTAPPAKIAVFEFELEDVSAAGALSKTESAADVSRMQAVKERTLRNCNGCDSKVASTLGAALSLIGVVTRVAQTEYYVALQVTDTKTGKVVNQQNAFFTGADDAWASGVRMLLKHGILADPGT